MQPGCRPKVPLAAGHTEVDVCRILVKGGANTSAVDTLRSFKERQGAEFAVIPGCFTHGASHMFHHTQNVGGDTMPMPTLDSVVSMLWSSQSQEYSEILQELFRSWGCIQGSLMIGNRHARLLGKLRLKRRY